MSVASAARAAQADADRLLFGADADQCVITRATAGATPTLDPVTLLPVAPARTTVYTGPCRLRTPGTVSAGISRETAGDEATIVTSILSVPVSAATLRVNDRVTFTASVNPRLLEMTFTVSGLVPGSHVSAQRVSVAVAF